MKRGRPKHSDVLTPREWEVLDLLREGLTNDEISRRLGISLNTTKFHVSEILSKLGVASREEAASSKIRPHFGLSGAAIWHKARDLTNSALGKGLSITLGAAVVLLVVAMAAGIYAVERRADGENSTEVPEPDRELSDKYAWLPNLPDANIRLPRGDQVTSTGPCDVLPNVIGGTTRRVGRISQAAFTVQARLRCPVFLTTTLCDPLKVYPLPGLVQVCDADGFRVDAYSTVSVNGDDECLGSHPAIMDGNGISGGISCEIPLLRYGSGSMLTIDVCFSVRDRESCASFPYVPP